MKNSSSVDVAIVGDNNTKPEHRSGESGGNGTSRKTAAMMSSNGVCAAAALNTATCSSPSSSLSIPAPAAAPTPSPSLSPSLRLAAKPTVAMGPARQAHEQSSSVSSISSPREEDIDRTAAFFTTDSNHNERSSRNKNSRDGGKKKNDDDDDTEARASCDSGDRPPPLEFVADYVRRLLLLSRSSGVGIMDNENEYCELQVAAEEEEDHDSYCNKNYEQIRQESNLEADRILQMYKTDDTEDDDGEESSAVSTVATKSKREQEQETSIAADVELVVRYYDRFDSNIGGIDHDITSRTPPSTVSLSSSCMSNATEQSTTTKRQKKKPLHSNERDDDTDDDTDDDR